MPNINLTTKSVTLLGMNNLQGGVTINSFDLPSNDDAGGIHLTLNTTVQNVRSRYLDNKVCMYLTHIM